MVLEEIELTNHSPPYGGWYFQRFRRNFWQLNTTNFVFILYDNFKHWINKEVIRLPPNHFPAHLSKKCIPLYLPYNLLCLHYNRKNNKFRLYVKEKITIKALNDLCNFFNCAIPSIKTHGIYLNEFDDPDKIEFKRTKLGEIYIEEPKCGENCILYKGKEYLIKINNGYGILDLKNLGIKDLSEVKGLENLKNLSRLNLSDNKLTEIKILGNLKNLYYLNLNNNKITEIKGLNSLRKLRYLYLNHNKITEIKDLESFQIREVQMTEYDMVINLGNNPIPISILYESGGLDKAGNANNPKRIVDYCIKNKIEKEKLNRSIKEKLIKILKVSSRFRLDMLMDILDMDKKFLIKNIKNLVSDFGLEINKNYLIIKNDTISDFIDALFLQFNEWEKDRYKKS